MSVIDPESDEVTFRFSVDYTALPANHHLDRFGRIWAIDMSPCTACVCGRSNVYAIDPKTLGLYNTVYVGGVLEPLEVSPDGRIALVAAGSKNEAWAIETAVYEPIKRIPTGRWPCDMDFTPDGKLAYIPNRDDDTVSVIDTSDWRVVRTIPIEPGSAPYMLTVSPNGKYVFVENPGTRSALYDFKDTGRGKSESVVETSSNKVIANIPLSGRPIFDEFTLDSRFSFITLRDKATVAVIDVERLAVVDRIAVGSAPMGLDIGPDGRSMYVPNSGESTVSIIDTETRRLVKTLAVSPGPVGIVKVKLASALVSMD